MKEITIPVYYQSDLDELQYPDDLQIGHYVWDDSMKRPILITDESSVSIHKSCATNTSRSRFATFEEIRKFISTNKIQYNTWYERKAQAISNIMYRVY